MSESAKIAYIWENEASLIGSIMHSSMDGEKIKARTREALKDPSLTEYPDAAVVEYLVDAKGNRISFPVKLMVDTTFYMR